MREKATIVLNERESNKSRAAEALQKALSEVGIASSRIPIGESIEKVIFERCPYVVVLDYLLGDYSTGLDVLARLNTRPPDERPAVFFLTDEPSVPVAIDAMKLGAKDYFELDHPQSVQKLTRAVQDALSLMLRHEKNASRAQRSPETFDDLVAEAETSRKVHEQVKLLATQRAPVLLVEGPRGSGKRTLAHHFSLLRGPESHLSCVDLRTSLDSAERLCGHSNRSHGPQLGDTLGLTILHAEEDDGALLEIVAANASTWWEEPGNSFITVCSESPAVLARWQHLIPLARRVCLPSLSERADDIPALVQRFLIEASAIGAERLKPFDAEALRSIAGQSWMGNLTQLRAVAIEAGLRLLREKSASATVLIAEQREQWEREMRTPSLEGLDSDLTKAQALELCGHNYRTAAALLGCSTRSLLLSIWSGRPVS